jgi:hypothetical protein
MIHVGSHALMQQRQDTDNHLSYRTQGHKTHLHFVTYTAIQPSYIYITCS